jgi:imidazolonepropionase
MRPRLLLTNIKSLYGITLKNVTRKSGKDMKLFESINNAWLQISENGLIESFGPMADCPTAVEDSLDCRGKLVLPSFVDSHTHLIHAGAREDEFVDRIRGLSYEEIAQKGGGILNSALKLNNTEEADLFREAFSRLQQCIESGTGAIEIKSGYGLNVDSELKMLRVAARLKAVSPIPIKITFLGAHAIPPQFKGNSIGYVNQIIEKMLPIIGTEKLADYIDVFCETNYFTVSEMDMLLEAGCKYGLKPKVHVNQFNSIGGIACAIKNKAVSVDHLEILNQNDIDQLKNSNTMPVALPACSFFIKIPFTPARQIIDSGLPLALATDYNPGSSPCLSMPFVVSLACINMGLLPEEAFNAATLNAAAAIELENELGSIQIGKKANLILTKPVNSLNYLPYSFAENWIEKIILS